MSPTLRFKYKEIKGKTVNNADAVCLACFIAGGSLSPVQIEHIAIQAYELAPSQFCWTHYPDRIDLRKVQYALKNEALSPDTRLVGSVKNGYQLTPGGLEWSRKVERGLREATPTETRDVAPKIEAERRRLRATTAFKKYSKGAVETLNRQDFDGFVRVNDYFPQAMRSQRIAKIENVVAGDGDLERVWTSLKSILGGNTDA